MDKKLVLVYGAIAVLTVAFLYMSFSSNTAPPDTSGRIKRVGTPPPPPPEGSNIRRATSPPPPPRSIIKSPRKNNILPPDYIAYKIIDRPEPILKLKKGSTRILRLNITKGNKPLTIEWFKKGNGSLKKVNIGKTFSVSPEDSITYYVATINDKTSPAKNIFFQVELDESADKNIAKNDDPKANSLKDITQERSTQPEKTEQPIPKEIDTQKIAQGYTIAPTQNLSINAKAGTALNIGYTIEGDSDYEVFWFHKPFNKKKGSLIKKRKTLNFSLKKLNKYHSGYFYIQIKDSTGKFHKSDEYKVTVK